MLKIRKISEKSFWHYYDNFEYSASDLRIDFNGSNRVQITRENGAFLFKLEGFDISEIIICDDTNTGSAEVFSNIQLLEQRLIELKYPPYDRGGGGGSIVTTTGDTITIDGTVVTVGDKNVQTDYDQAINTEDDYFKNRPVLTPLATAGLEVRNKNNVLQGIITDYMQLSGLTWDDVNKRIVVLQPITPRTFFIDSLNGDDTTGEYENEYLPYQTYQAIVNDLPTDDGSAIIIIYKNDLVVDDVIPNRKIIFLSNESNTINFNFNGNIYDSSGITILNELSIICPLGNIVFTSGVFTCNNTSITIRTSSIDQGGLLGAGYLFNSCERIDVISKESSFPRQGLADVNNIGLDNRISSAILGNMFYAAFNSNTILKSNNSSLLELNECSFAGTQSISLVTGTTNLNLLGDVKHEGTGSCRFVTQSGVDQISTINFNNISLKNCNIFAMSVYQETTLTGRIIKWEDTNNREIIYPTQVLNGTTGERSSIKFINFFLDELETAKDFLYTHPSTQSAAVARFKLLFIDSHLIIPNHRFLSLSNRSNNFEITNTIIEDMGTVGNPSIFRNDGLVGDLSIISKAPFYIETTDPLTLIGRLNEM